MEPVTLSADGLLLRAYAAADAAAVYRACQDPEILRWTRIPTGEAAARTWVVETTPELWAGGQAFVFAVCAADTGELLGQADLFPIDREPGTAAVGYWVAPWARRRRVATRALRILSGWAFRDLGMHRLSWRAQVGNMASRAAAELAGVRIEGIMRRSVTRRDGSWADEWLGSLLPDDDPPEPATGAELGALAAVFAAPQPVLTGSARGGPIRLRPHTDGDVDRIVASCRDPETVRWTSVPNPYQRRDAEGFVREYGPGRWARGGGALFAIADAADAYCGSIELRRYPHEPDCADVGFHAGPWARGRGYATAALRILARWGFDTLGLARIEWQAHVGNEASRRVAERAGFTVEGVRRAGIVHRGKRVDSWSAALLPTDPPGS